MRPIFIAFLLLAVTVLAQTAKQDNPAICTPASTTPAGIQQDCEALHTYYTGKFVASVGFGYDRMPRVEKAISDKQWQIGQDKYVVKNIQLISMLKHDPPVVYPPVTSVNEFDHHRNPPVLVTVTDPKAEAAEKRDADGFRPLNEFETAALKQLAAKKETMAVPGDGVMVGALRAEAACIECHDVEQGTLLGAFTYTLEKQGASDSPARKAGLSVIVNGDRLPLQGAPASH